VELYTVVLGIDAAGAFPILLRPSDSLPAGDVRYRLVGNFGTWEEAAREVERLHRDPPRVPGPRPWD
jgi:hypothetical protein